MIGENIKYYRQCAGMNQEELAKAIGLSKMAISNYENGKREADSSIIIRIAKALNTRPMNLLTNPADHVQIVHGQFRKQCAMGACEQNIFYGKLDRYLARFSNALNILGNRVLPDIPSYQPIEYKGDIEETAMAIRHMLQLSENGPIGNLVDMVENKGYIVCQLDIENQHFSGNYGEVNGRPYIAINSTTSPERQRYTIMHELVHKLVAISDSNEEKIVEAIAGAVLFTRSDVLRELGPKRTNIWGELRGIQTEYGISMQTVLMRARQCDVITHDVYERHQKQISAAGLRKDEKSKLQPEKSRLLEQCVVRAVSEGIINLSKAAELLDTTKEQAELVCCGGFA